LVTIPAGKSGRISSISNFSLTLGCSGTSTTVVSYLNIYSGVGGTQLGGSSEPIEISDCGPGVTGFTETYTYTINLDSPISVIAGEQYYIELEKVTPWFGNFYFGQDMTNPYSEGSAYIDRLEVSGSDLQLQVNMLVP
jgi:hypothetical protein